MLLRITVVRSLLRWWELVHVCCCLLVCRSPLEIVLYISTFFCIFLFTKRPTSLLCTFILRNYVVNHRNFFFPFYRLVFHSCVTIFFLMNSLIFLESLIFILSSLLFETSSRFSISVLLQGLSFRFLLFTFFIIFYLRPLYWRSTFKIFLSCLF